MQNVLHTWSSSKLRINCSSRLGYSSNSSLAYFDSLDDVDAAGILSCPSHLLSSFAEGHVAWTAN